MTDLPPWNQRQKPCSSHLHSMNLEKQQNPVPNLICLDNIQNSIHFVCSFKYLGLIIASDLTEDAEIQSCISKASQQLGCFHHVFRNKDIVKGVKYWLYIMGLINALLWGCKSCNLNECNQIKLRASHHSAIRCILGIGIDKVIEQHITNKSMKSDFKCIPSIDIFNTCRVWCYIGKVYQDNDSL